MKNGDPQNHDYYNDFFKKRRIYMVILTLRVLTV